MTAPTCFRGQVDRVAAWIARFMKYRFQETRFIVTQTSSLAAKKNAFSMAAFSSESEPWIALRSMDSP
jgi:hypothetical protein